jgi:DNA-binding NarL/FixJ family response regulator
MTAPRALQRSDRVSAPAEDTTVDLVLADGHPLVLRGMQHLFQAERGFAVQACCTDDEEVLAAAVQHQPDVLVLDPHLPGRGALVLLRRLTILQPTLRVVLLATALSKRQVAEAVRVGVRGVVLKDMPPALLVECVRRVHDGETWIENGSCADLVQRLVHRDIGRRNIVQQLTPRELEVVRLVGDGLLNQDITARLDITEGTVKVHLHSIYEKLKIKTRVQLALCARDAGLV